MLELDKMFRGETFRSAEQISYVLETPDAIFRFCAFEAAAVTGGDCDGVFLSCQFRELDLSWGFFNLALFANCHFKRVTFRGTAFGACRFVDCTFSDCRFLPDEAGEACSAPATRLCDCVAENCEGWGEVFEG